MEVSDWCLSLVDVTPDLEDYSDSWIQWKNSRKPLRFELVATRESDGPRLVARVGVSLGLVRQKFRNNWLGRIGRQLEPANIATLTKFEITDPEFLPSKMDLLEHLVGELSHPWQTRHQESLTLIECNLSRVGLQREDLGAHWTVLDLDGKEVATPGPEGVTNSTGEFHAIRFTAEGLENDLPLRTPRVPAYKKKVRPQWNSEPEFSPAILSELVGLFGTIPDPRLEERTKVAAEAILAIICLARLAGSRGVREHCRWAGLLSCEQRKAIGLRAEGRGQIPIPSHHTISKFIKAGRISREECCEEREFFSKFRYDRPADGDRRPVLVEAGIRGDFNSWLQEHGRDVLGAPLWPKDEPGVKKSATPKAPGSKVRKSSEHWSHVGEEYQKLHLPGSSENTLRWMDWAEILDLSCHLESLFSKRDPRIVLHRTCPLRTVVFLLGLGRLFVRRKGAAVWAWSHRFDFEQLAGMGLDPDREGKPSRPGPGYLERVIKEFGEVNFAKLDRRVQEWLEEKGKVGLLIEDGGKLRKSKRFYVG